MSIVFPTAVPGLDPSRVSRAPGQGAAGFLGMLSSKRGQEAAKSSAFFTITAAEAEVFRPVRGRVLVRKDRPAVSKGRIHLVARDKNGQRRVPAWGTVIRCGPNPVTPKKNTEVPHSVAAGDRVLLPAFCGHDVEVAADDHAYVVVEAGEIMAVETPEEAAA